jgi:gliding motility-associated lipoprotein GldH
MFSMNPKRIFGYLVAFILACTFMSSCSQPQITAYQKQVGIPAAKWSYNFQPEFSFDISDTSAQYRVFLIFRYDAAFEYSNIWLRLKMKAPGDSTYNLGNRIETVLIAHDGSRLGNDVGGIYEYKVQLDPKTDYQPFTKAGSYTIKLEQIMRKNPLVGLINVGIRVERFNAKQAVD